jgi:NADP-dependent 3-hydroxy acid dehydrogenase YdfG
MSLAIDLSGRRIVVTGASSGIGAAVCRAIVERGGSVAMLARRRDLLDGLARDLGDRAVAVPSDVTDLDELRAAIDRAARELGGLDGVVTAAGQSMFGSIVSGTPQRWRELLDLNLVGALSTIRWAVEHFPPSGRRDIVVVGSSIVITPVTGAGVYRASKSGLHAAVDTMRLELAPAGINVGEVTPGFFDTDTTGGSGTVYDGDVPPVDIPLFAEGGAPAPPELLADAIVFMLGLPDGVCINELVMRPTRQLNP